MNDIQSLNNVKIPTPLCLSWDIGLIAISSKAKAKLNPLDVERALERLAASDFDEVEAVAPSLGSSRTYTDRHKARFWIIQEPIGPTGQMTSVLLPEEILNQLSR